MFCSIHIPKQSLCPVHGSYCKSEEGRADSDGGHLPGQLSLLERLEHHYPGMFHKELMVTAFDVKYGKPNPEPYLMALKKEGSKRMKRL